MATDCYTSILVPPLNIRNYQPDGWDSWIRQFKVRAKFSKFPLLSDQEKVAVLLEKLGDEIIPIFKTLNVEVDKVSYKQLIQLLASYFHPRKTRHVFFSAKQFSQESFDHFAQRLTALSYPCCFGPLQDRILQDVFLLNMHDKYNLIRDSILNNHRDLSFQEAVSLSNEQLFEKCYVPSSRNVSGFNESISTVWRVPSHSTATDNAVSVKREEVGLDSSSKSHSSKHSKFDKSTFKAKLPPSPNNSLPATCDDKGGSSLKLTMEIKNPLGKTPFSDRTPKLDFNFKCFPLNGAVNDGKPPSVNGRLSKFRQTPVCGGVYSRLPPSIPTNHAKKQRVGQATSNHSMNTRTGQQENRVAQASFVEKDAFGVRSGTTMSQLTGNVKFLSLEADNVPQENFFGTPTQNVEVDPNPEPPVSKTCFSDVIIISISEHDYTIHVCPVEKCQFLGIIEDDLKELLKRKALKQISTIAIGEIYAALFKGSWYRAEIVSANMKTKSVRVSFCDYGNEGDIRLADLRRLPKKFQDLEPLSFPIRLPEGAPAVEPGCRLKIRPLFLEDGWIWAVELRTRAQ